MIGENTSYYVKYQDIAKQRAKEYYAKNKEKIKEIQREKCKSLSIEEKKTLISKQKEWFNWQRETRWSEKKSKRIFKKADIIIILLFLIKVSM